MCLPTDNRTKDKENPALNLLGEGRGPGIGFGCLQIWMALAAVVAVSRAVAGATTNEPAWKPTEQLPFVVNVELNNNSAPSTPALRLQTTLVADDLWQSHQAAGVQYAFSPENYKTGDRWNFYDLPRVADYCAFYRLPLDTADSPRKQLTTDLTRFGYSEANHRFLLPSASSTPSLTFFAGRATVDYGLNTLQSQTLFNLNGNRLDESTVQHNSTVNDDLGLCLQVPVPAEETFHSVLSLGMDLKHYESRSAETNIFVLSTRQIDYNTIPPAYVTNTSTDYSPLPFTVARLDYLPLTLSYLADWKDRFGHAAFVANLGADVWYSSRTSTTATTNGTSSSTDINGQDSLQYLTGSSQSHGYWVVLRPGFSQQFVIHTNWIATVHAAGQWASEPLIRNEQFGIGGINSVRGYYEGEGFGDTGWQVSAEQATPKLFFGGGDKMATFALQGLVYTDYAVGYLLDPQGRPDHQRLWSAGLGLVATLGSHLRASLLFAEPFISTRYTRRDRGNFEFSVSSRF